MSFARAVAFTGRWEGGKVDDPVDPGGRTGVWGITQAAFNQWLGTGGPQDVWMATPDQVLSFLRSYWTRMGGPGFDGIDERLGILMFDASYNHGNGMAIRFLQRALGGLVDDGSFGPATFDRLHDVYAATPQTLLDDLVEERRSHYIARSLAPGLIRFLHGWLARADDCERVANADVAALDAVVASAHHASPLPMALPGIV